jgi:putative oxygen-independent coproporphyrinogen III oxidase
MGAAREAVPGAMPDARSGADPGEGPGAAPDAGPSAARPPVALYIHVPFCVSLCPYCDFVVYAGSAARGPAARIEAFTAAVSAEIGLRGDAADAVFGRDREPLGSVYLGGGTPTLLPASTIAALLDAVRSRFGIADGAEITIEANPGPDERGDAAALADAGVTRLSLGAQAFDAGLLRRLGRRHRPDDIEAAVLAARSAGIGSISLDLLYDVPGQTEAAWSAALEAAIGLGVDHVSAYALTLDDPDAEGLTGALGDHLPTTAGARRWRAAAVPDQDDDRAAAQYQHAVTRLAAAGFRGYEISNWARPGHESRHNLVYWRRDPYEAVGPGAHAFNGVTRRWNAARLDGYLAALAPAGAERPAQPGLPPGGEEHVDAAAAAIEAAILGLRLDEGIALPAAEAGPLAPHIGWARAAGLVEDVRIAGADRVRLTTDGRLLSNELFARLV